MILQELQRQLALTLAADPHAKMVPLPLSTVRALIQDIIDTTQSMGVKIDESLSLCVGSKELDCGLGQKGSRRQALRDLPAYAQLSTRARNILRDENIYTVAQFLEYSDSDWLRLPRMGIKTFAELQQWAKQAGVVDAHH